MTRRIESIGIVGGGSAGYFTALLLKKAFPEMKVTLIESSRIPVIGVGEATTPLIMNFLHKKLGYSVQEFFQKAKPTIKLGVKFNWGRPGEHYYNNPFGTVDISNAIYHTKNFNNCSLVSLLMDEGKAPFVRQGNKIIPLKLSRGYAYHIDNKNFLAYLKEKLLSSGCNYIDTEIGRATQDEKSIESVVSSDGAVHRYDLYVDCSGFRSVLLGKTLHSDWIDYSKSLITNRAIIGMQPHGGYLKPYTTATTLNHGWLWTIPIQDEDHLGYVFAKEFCSDDEAFDELRNHCKNVVNEKVISFRTGRHRNSWEGNVVGIGNAFAFIEPLESTGIHMILSQLRKLTRCFEDGYVSDERIRNYNQQVNASWDHLRWFIAIHFKYNRELDTPFWKACNESIDVSGVSDYLEYFSEHGPILYNKDHPLYEAMNRDAIFSAFSFDVNLAGCGVNQEYFEKRQGNVIDGWIKLHQFNRQLVSQAVTHKEGVDYLQEYSTDFIPDWFTRN